MPRTLQWLDKKPLSVLLSCTLESFPAKGWEEEGVTQPEAKKNKVGWFANASLLSLFVFSFFVVPPLFMPCLHCPCLSIHACLALKA